MSKHGWKASFLISIKAWGKRKRPAADGEGRSSAATTFRRWFVRSVFILLAVPGAVELGGEADQVLATELGQRQELHLIGGPHLVLNTATTVTTRESSSHQTIDLQSGEMLVDAADKTSKRVWIAIGRVVIDAKDAKFSVRRLESGDCSVYVFRGEVTLFPDSPRSASFTYVKLERGRAATVRLGTVILSRFDQKTAARLLAWIDGKLIFDGDSLGDVVSEFNRYNREKMQIADASIAAFRIGGSYSATNPQGFAKRLRTFGIRADMYRLSGSGASVIVLTKSKSGASKRSAYGGFGSRLVQS